MAVKLLFNELPQFVDANGDPYSGAKLFTYVAGSSTKQTTYQDSGAITANSNPIVCDSAGRVPYPIWGTTGVSYKLVLAPSTDTDPPTSPIFTIDNVTGINDTTLSNDEWVSGPAPTYVSATSFTLAGDQTSTFSVGRRVKTTNSGGTVYSTITGSTFGALTTITVVNDSGSLDSGLSAVSYGLLSSSNISMPWVAAINSIGSISVGKGNGQVAKKAVGSNGQIIVADSTQSDGLIWTDFSKDPLNVNPNMLIDQINEGSLYTAGSGTQGLDGWSSLSAGAGVFKTRRLADPDNASRYVTEITCTTADAAIGATDVYAVYTAIEGYDLMGLSLGTASAGSITIQFQFKTNVTGTYCINVTNNAQNRRYVGTITVADTAVHDYSVTLTLDTSGTWLYTNGVGAYIALTLAGGSNFQVTGGAWTASGSGVSGCTSAQCNFMSANTNVAYLGRFHVIPGNVVCAYKPSDIQRELAKCQRYYAKSVSQGSAPGGALGDGDLRWIATGAFNPDAFAIWKYPVTMRTTPTTTIYSPITGASGNCRNYSSGADEAAAVVGAGTSHLNIYNNSTGTAGHQYGAYAVANARLS